MDLGFRGPVAEYYQRYRRGYPLSVIDAVVAAFGLTSADTVVDLGCGTGQLAVPLAGVVGRVLAVDPSADMLAVGRRSSPTSVDWIVGSDSDLPAIVGDVRPGAVVVGQALHWMDHPALFRSAASLVRDGGGIAVVTNGEPLWLQDVDWSRALRGFLEGRLGASLTATCGTDEASQRRYADGLSAAGYTVSSTVVEYTAGLAADEIAGGLLSAMTPDQLPDRAFTDDVLRVVSPFLPITERVAVRILTGVRAPAR